MKVNNEGKYEWIPQEILVCISKLLLKKLNDSIYSFIQNIGSLRIPYYSDLVSVIGNSKNFADKVS